MRSNCFFTYVLFDLAFPYPTFLKSKDTTIFFKVIKKNSDVILDSVQYKGWKKNTNWEDKAQRAK